MIDAATLPASTHSDDHRSLPGDACTWCGGTHDVATYRDEPRCAMCREHETVIDAARRFIGMYGLRPLGGAVTSEDDEELAHRTGARAARAALDRSRSATAPRKRAPRTTVKRTTTARTTKDSVDVEALGVRVAGLLEQLGTIDSEIASIDGSTGLPARARMSDLERQRTTVLTTLAALEKARRNAR